MNAADDTAWKQIIMKAPVDDYNLWMTIAYGWLLPMDDCSLWMTIAAGKTEKSFKREESEALCRKRQKRERERQWRQFSDPSSPPDWQMNFSQSAPAYIHTSLDLSAGCPSTYQCNVNELLARAVSKDSDHAPWEWTYIEVGAWLWVCAIRSMMSKTWYHSHSACLNGQRYLAKSERDI